MCSVDIVLQVWKVVALKWSGMQKAVIWESMRNILFINSKDLLRAAKSVGGTISLWQRHSWRHNYPPIVSIISLHILYDNWWHPHCTGVKDSIWWLCVFFWLKGGTLLDARYQPWVEADCAWKPGETLSGDWLHLNIGDTAWGRRTYPKDMPFRGFSASELL